MDPYLFLPADDPRCNEFWLSHDRPLLSRRTGWSTKYLSPLKDSESVTNKRIAKQTKLFARIEHSPLSPPFCIPKTKTLSIPDVFSSELTFHPDSPPVPTTAASPWLSRPSPPACSARRTLLGTRETRSPSGDEIPSDADRAFRGHRAAPQEAATKGVGLVASIV